MASEEPQKRLSNAEYQTKKQRYRRLQFRLRITLCIAILVVILTITIAPNGDWTKATSALLATVGVIVVVVEVSASKSYFSEKRRQGYKLGPYIDTPRDPPPAGSG